MMTDDGLVGLGWVGSVLISWVGFWTLDLWPCLGSRDPFWIR